MKNKPLIVGIGGTTRAGSSSEKLIRCVLQEIEAQGGKTKIFGGEALAKLPHFNPENPQRSAEQQQFIESIRQADGLVIGSPAYHGGVSGLVKNAIDLLEDLREDTNSYFSGRAVGLVVTAAGWQACGVTLQALRGIVHALRGWPTPLGIAVNSLDQKPFDPDGRLIDQNIKAAIKLQAEQVMVFASK